MPLQSVNKLLKLTLQYKEGHQQDLRYRLSHITPKYCLDLGKGKY